MNHYARDLIERALATFGEAFCAALLLSLVGAPAIPSLSLVEKAAGAGVVALLALFKGLTASFLGQNDSASLAPSVGPGTVAAEATHGPTLHPDLVVDWGAAKTAAALSSKPKRRPVKKA